MQGIATCPRAHRAAGGGGARDGRSAAPGLTGAVVGVSYKPNIADTRESPAIEVISGLRARGARVSIYDPVAGSVRIDGEMLYSLPCPPQPGEHDLVIVTCRHDAVDEAAITDAASSRSTPPIRCPKRATASFRAELLQQPTVESRPLPPALNKRASRPETLRASGSDRLSPRSQAQVGGRRVGIRPVLVLTRVIRSPIGSARLSAAALTRTSVGSSRSWCPRQAMTVSLPTVSSNSTRYFHTSCAFHVPGSRGSALRDG